MNKLIGVINGKKSYILAIALVLYAVGGVISGNLSIYDAIGILFGGGAVATIKHAVSKLE